jgi:hypothetical protein
VIRKDVWFFSYHLSLITYHLLKIFLAISVKRDYILRAISPASRYLARRVQKDFSQFIMQQRNIRAYPHSVVIRMQEPAPPEEPRLHPFRRVSCLVIASLIAFPFLLQATSTTAQAQTGAGDAVQTLAASSIPATSTPKPLKERVIALRRKESAEGERLTLTSDAPLDDYSSYVEDERLFVVVPLTALAGAQGNINGRGFNDMKVEPRGHDILLSFRLQVGASFHVRQKFNRLDLVFSTNERANRN